HAHLLTASFDGVRSWSSDFQTSNELLSGHCTSLSRAARMPLILTSFKKSASVATRSFHAVYDLGLDENDALQLREIRTLYQSGVNSRLTRSRLFTSSATNGLYALTCDTLTPAVDLWNVRSGAKLGSFATPLTAVPVDFAVCDGDGGVNVFAVSST